jgi:DNA-binding IclR family transcriptional regulator
VDSPEQVSSADNVLRLLVVLRERGRLRVAEAAELLSVTPPTAHRLLTTLKKHQFAEQDRQRSYLAGPRLIAALSLHQDPASKLQTIGHPHLEELSRRTGETCHLITLEGNGIRFVDGVESRHALRVGSRVGLLLPAHTTSGGKVLLAPLPDSELLALYPERQTRMRDGSSRDITILRRELATVRRHGYALNLEASEQGVNAIGVPVTLAPSGRAVAAVVVACPSVRGAKQRLLEFVPHMHATAGAIAQHLR